MSENYWDKLMEDDDHAASYMDSYGEGPGCATRLLIGQFINDGESVLDVGCGPGWNLDHFDQYGPKISKYLGLDYSERFVRVALNRWNQKRAAAVTADANIEWPHGVPFAVSDCRDLNLSDETYDVVLLQDVLEHTNGYEKAVSEALRVAKKRVVVTFWRTFNSGENDDINDDGDDGYGATYSKPKWERYLDSLGLAWMDTETDATANRWHAVYVIEKGKL
jgi:ubiquinone/menaquinone biosynthesis C-methylase UbiE